VLVTTADHALLTAAMVDHFCVEHAVAGRDVVAGVARHDLVAARSRYLVERSPGSGTGGYCGMQHVCLPDPTSPPGG